MVPLPGFRFIAMHVLWSVLMISLLSAIPQGGDAATEQAKVKSSFLHNFASYIQWPAKAQGGKTFRVGVIGKDALGAALDTAFKDKNINDRKVEVSRFGAWKTLRNKQAVAACQVLILNCATRAEEAEVLAALRGKPVLLVGESIGFVARGGGIQFFLQEGKVRFEINQPVLQQCGLKASAKLLQLSRKAPAGGKK